MDRRIVHPSPDSPEPAAVDRSNSHSSVPATEHPVLSRLIEEVRNERRVEARYDRVHNRHNRGR